MLQWRDVITALFVSGAYGAKQPLHTYSQWFTATRPWQVTLGVVPGPTVGPAGTPFACGYLAHIAIDVRNPKGLVAAGSIDVPLSEEVGGFAGSSLFQVTGRLRLDVLSHCSTFSVRIDGVQSVGERLSLVTADPVRLPGG